MSTKKAVLPKEGYDHKLIPRQIGRVGDAYWGEIKTAAAKAQRSFTEWSVSILLRAAKNGHSGYDVREPYGLSPQRQLGRISEQDWEAMKQAAENSGRTFTEWAVGILLRAARTGHRGFDLRRD